MRRLVWNVGSTPWRHSPYFRFAGADAEVLDDVVFTPTRDDKQASERITTKATNGQATSGTLH
jgi:hypothetical protein